MMRILSVQLIPAMYAVGQSTLYARVQNLDNCHTTSTLHNKKQPALFQLPKVGTSQTAVFIVTEVPSVSEATHTL